MRIQGELCTICDMSADDLSGMIGVPVVQIRAPDGRIVTITGLTRDEVKDAASLFLANVYLIVGAT